MQQISTCSSLKLYGFPPKMPAMTTTLGKTIKSRLIELGKTQEWLAEATSVSKNAVSKWIKDGKISRANAVAAAKALGLTADQLLMGQPLVDVSPPAETTLERLDVEEKRLLELYRRASRDGRLMIYGAATVAPKDDDSDNSLIRPQ